MKWLTSLNLLLRSHKLAHRIHIFYAMPGIGKTTAIAKLWARYNPVLIRPTVYVVDTDDLRLKQEVEILNYAFDVVQEGWSEHIILITNQWRFARLAETYGCDLRFLAAYAPGESGASMLQKAVSARADADFFNDDRVRRWVDSPDLREFLEYHHGRRELVVFDDIKDPQILALVRTEFSYQLARLVSDLCNIEMR